MSTPSNYCLFSAQTPATPMTRERHSKHVRFNPPSLPVRVLLVTQHHHSLRFKAFSSILMSQMMISWTLTMYLSDFLQISYRLFNLWQMRVFLVIMSLFLFHLLLLLYQSLLMTLTTRFHCNIHQLSSTVVKQ